jgi:uncharacterized protein
MASSNLPEVWSDLHQSLVQDAQGNIKRSINEASVRTSIDNILGTSPGERVFLPEFACNIKNLLFEPISQYKMDQYARTIREAIERWDDRVIVDGVDLQVDVDNHYLAITTRFSIRSYKDTYSHTTTITT